MDAIDCIVSRRSIRKFMTKAIEFDKVMMCIEAATKAPSSGNIQDYKFILISDRDKIKQIAEHCTEQYWIQNAAVLVVVAADTETSETYYGLRGQRFYSVQNSAAAVQNMILTAHALGLGACWVGSFDEGYLQDYLGMPDNVRPQAIVPIGYPDEVPGKREEKSLRMMVYFNQYGATIKNMNTLLNEYNKEIERIYKDISGTVEDKSTTALGKLKYHAKKFYNKAKEERKKRREE